MTTSMRCKTLLDNWVEERQCEDLEQDSLNPDGTLGSHLHRQGHKGILSRNVNADMEKTTTVKDSYSEPTPCSVRTTGRRHEMLQQQIFSMVSAQVETEFHVEPLPVDYTSVTKSDFSKDFAPHCVPPIKTHDLNEQPASYWGQNVDKITGVSQNHSHLSPFHRNAAFSTPIEQYLDKPKPHESHCV